MKFKTLRNLDSVSRRDFLAFLGLSSAAAAAILAKPELLSAMVWNHDLQSLPPMGDDAVITAPGIDSEILIRYGDIINDAGEAFGFNNDFIAFFPLVRGRLVPQNSTEALAANEALLWVNHETPIGGLMHGNPGPALGGIPKTMAQVREEQLAVGGSVIRIVRDSLKSQWRFGGRHALNRRITALTQIPFAGTGSKKVSIGGSDHATGTLANCAGGVTPWGTVLSCEENYHEFYGEFDREYDHRDSNWGKHVKIPAQNHDWHIHAVHHPFHYGWVVEIDPLTGKSRKLVAMGRAARECATVTTARDGRAVVYSGDDHRGGCIFKFISKKPGDLTDGDLYAADVERGRWILLSWDKNPILRKSFHDQMDVLLHARSAGLAAGATAMDRPEDVELHPLTGSVYISLTNNHDRGNYHGSLLKLEETNSDPLTLEFRTTTFLTGGKETGFSSPDNLLFDRAGNLLFTTDVAKDKLHKGPYSGLGNNGLFVVPVKGRDAGKVLRIASAPVEAEFTGPCFSPDEKTLFLSVQHPGEATPFEKGAPLYSSSWPDGVRGGKPCPALIALQNLPLVGARPQS